MSAFRQEVFARLSALEKPSLSVRCTGSNGGDWDNFAGSYWKHVPTPDAVRAILDHLGLELGWSDGVPAGDTVVKKAKGKA